MSGMDRRVLWFVAFLVPVMIWSAIAPFDRFTWWLEVAPVVVGIAVLLATQRRFPLSTLVLVLGAFHAVVLLVGGHYTYARVPGFEGWWGDPRNNYDKLGHFMQGFWPALFVREILLRCSPLRASRWLGFLTGSVCLAFSALYELIEWWVAVFTGAAAEDFLGTQGYAWDTQSDMAWALSGAILALVVLRGWHNASIQRAVARANSGAR